MTRRAKTRLVVVLALVGAMTGLVWATPGSTTVTQTARAEYSEDDCAALLNLSDNIPNVDGDSGTFFGAQAAAAAEGFDETADEIDDKKLKKALRTIADVYEDLGKAKNTAAALAVTVRAGKRYGKAMGRWVKANLECATANVTLPTIPSDITLPSNVTIPTIPR